MSTMHAKFVITIFCDCGKETVYSKGRNNGETNVVISGTDNMGHRDTVTCECGITYQFNNETRLVAYLRKKDEIKSQKRNHEDGDYSYLCGSEYCRCLQ